jgi:hypothetical protein
MYQFFKWGDEPLQIFFTEDATLSDIEEAFNNMCALRDNRLGLDEYWNCSVYVEEYVEYFSVVISGDNDYLSGKVLRVSFEN